MCASTKTFGQKPRLSLRMTISSFKDTKLASVPLLLCQHHNKYVENIREKEKYQQTKKDPSLMK